jgi:hypothetical protein
VRMQIRCGWACHAAPISSSGFLSQKPRRQGLNSHFLRIADLCLSLDVRKLISADVPVHLDFAL